MKYSVDNIKLKHLDLIIQDEVDFNKIMTEIFGYKNTWFDKRFLFEKKFSIVYGILDRFRAIDISKLDDISHCKIKCPKNMDMISFQERLELSQCKQSSQSLLEQMVNVISLACFTTHHKVEFNSDSKLFSHFKTYVENQPLVQMVALYNHIEKKLDESNETWNNLFLQVQITDVDYEQAGGPAMLGMFNLLNTSKKLIADFDVKYKEAFLLPYVLVQTNNLESARRNWVQQRMTEIKERKMKQSRNQQ